MAILSRGDRGDRVRELQTALRDAGFDPGPIDGIFGPRTESAVRRYEESQGWEVDGRVGNRLLASLNLSTDPTGNEPSDYTDDPHTRFNSVPGQPEVWVNSDTGQWYLMYEVPGLDPPVPLLFTIPTVEDQEVLFGRGITPEPDERFTSDQLTRSGAIVFGSTDTIPEDADGQVWPGFLERMDRMMETMPWLEDPEVFAVFAGAWIEGRGVPQKWELEATDYWQSRNEAQRQWMWLSARDPKEAERIAESNNVWVYNQFKDGGLASVDKTVVDYIATQYSQGNWSENYMLDQINGLLGGRRAQGMDRGLRRFLRKNAIELGVPSTGESEVRRMWDTWLGPAHSPTDQQVERWAARWRDNSQEAQADLEQRLRRQRLALYPEYEDESMTYDDIAEPWRAVFFRMWGQQADESDSVFTKMLHTNDLGLNEQHLHKEGIRRNNQQVMKDLLSNINRSFGGARRPLQ